MLCAALLIEDSTCHFVEWRNAAVMTDCHKLLINQKMLLYSPLIFNNSVFQLYTQLIDVVDTSFFFRISLF